MSEEVTNTGSAESILSDTTSVADSATVAPETTGTSAEFNFRDHLEEDLRSHTSLESIKDLNGLAKSYVHAQSMIGGSVRVPGADATAAEKAEFFDKIKDVDGVGKLPDPTNEAEIRAFYNKLGCPEKPEGYEIELPEGATISGHEDMIEAAHAAGLTSSQLQALADVQMRRSAAEVEALQSARETGLNTLKEEFGDAYENKIAEAKIAARMYSESMPNEVSELLNGPAGNNPALIKMLADLGSTVREGSTKGTETAAPAGMSHKEVSEKIAALYSDGDHMAAVADFRHPHHQTAIRKRDELYALRAALEGK